MGNTVNLWGTLDAMVEVAGGATEACTVIDVTELKRIAITFAATYGADTPDSDPTLRFASSPDSTNFDRNDAAPDADTEFASFTLVRTASKECQRTKELDVSCINYLKPYIVNGATDAADFAVVATKEVA